MEKRCIIAAKVVLIMELPQLSDFSTKYAVVTM